jgi:hypothetical protein
MASPVRRGSARRLHTVLKSFEYLSETKFVFPAAECLENAVWRERRSARQLNDETGSNREFAVQQC